MQVYQSSDIQQQLSSSAFSFTNADREFKELMSLTAKNPAVLAVCLKDGESNNPHKSISVLIFILAFYAKIIKQVLPSILFV